MSDMDWQGLYKVEHDASEYQSFSWLCPDENCNAGGYSRNQIGPP